MNQSGGDMIKSELEYLQGVIREHLVEYGPYTRLLMSRQYADQLKESTRLDPDQVLDRLEIVDGLEESFIIIP